MLPTTMTEPAPSPWLRALPAAAKAPHPLLRASLAKAAARTAERLAAAAPGSTALLARREGMGPFTLGALPDSASGALPLDLGGTTDPVNLFPERASPHAVSQARRELESRLRRLGCAGKLTHTPTRQQIAADGPAVHTGAFGVVPTR